MKCKFCKKAEADIDDKCYVCYKEYLETPKSFGKGDKYDLLRLMGVTK